jgi:hypothetical protein
MKLDKDYVKKYRIAKRLLHDDKTEQELFKFPNGYGCSLIKGPYSYGGPEGLYEIAVIRYLDETDFNLCYDTPICNDVIGHLTRKQVKEYLKQIFELPEPKEG